MEEQCGVHVEASLAEKHIEKFKEVWMKWAVIRATDVNLAPSATQALRKRRITHSLLFEYALQFYVVRVSDGWEKI